MVNHILCILCSFSEVFVVERTGNAGFGKVNLCQKALGAIIVDAVVPA